MSSQAKYKKFIQDIFNKNKPTIIFGLGATGTAIYDFAKQLVPANCLLAFDSRNIQLTDPQQAQSPYYYNINNIKALNKLLFKKLAQRYKLNKRNRYHYRTGIGSSSLGQRLKRFYHGAIISPSLAFDDVLVSYLRSCWSICSELDLFWHYKDAYGWGNTKIIGITGSNGKSTTVKLLEYLHDSALAAGNIGLPLMQLLTHNEPLQIDNEKSQSNNGTLQTNNRSLQIKPSPKPAVLILELSSYQLEWLCPNSKIRLDCACILNLSPDHLARHKNLAKYAAAKQNIYKIAKTIVYNQDDPATYPKINKQQLCTSKQLCTSQPLSFSTELNNQAVYHLQASPSGVQLARKQQPLIAVKDCQLLGLANYANMLACLAITEQLNLATELEPSLPGLKPSLKELKPSLPELKPILQKLALFPPLAHRFNLVSTKLGCTWINDSKATNVGATLAAIANLTGQFQLNQQANSKIVFILGGDPKGVDLSELREPVSRTGRVALIIGAATEQLLNILQNHLACEAHKSLEATVEAATRWVQPGDAVLLAPACASLDMFRDYAERGEKFIKAIDSLGDL